MEERNLIKRRRRKKEYTLLLVNMAEMVLSVAVMYIGEANNIPGLILLGFGLMGLSGISFMHHA